MNQEPLVTCVMLVDGRTEMVKRAIASYVDQTYARKRLLIYDTGETALANVLPGVATGSAGVQYWRGPSGERRSIGALRNIANGHAATDVFAHWDSDDWSAPDRLAVQVAALVVSGCDVVGFHDVLFWSTERSAQDVDVRHEGAHLSYREARCFGQAWTYTALHPDGVIGASLLYRRQVWERRTFPDRNAGEDTLWLMRQRNVYPLPSIVRPAPRMVCEIHGANTASKIDAGKREWRRAPEHDRYCNEVMKLGT